MHARPGIHADLRKGVAPGSFLDVLGEPQAEQAHMHKCALLQGTSSYRLSGQLQA